MTAVSPDHHIDDDGDEYIGDNGDDSSGICLEYI